MKKSSLTAVIINALCAVVWSVTAILGAIYQTYNDSAILFALHILCALIWIAAFTVQLKRYRSGK